MKKKTWKGAEIYVKAVINLLLFALTTLLVIYVLPHVLIYFMPFVIGAIIAWIAGPIIRFCERKLRLRRKVTTALVTIVVISMVLTMAYFVGVWLANNIIRLIAEMPALWDRVIREATAAGDRIALLINQLPDDLNIPLMELPDTLSYSFAEAVAAVGVPTFAAMGRFAMSLPLVIVNVVMCLLSAYLFIAERGFVARLRVNLSDAVNMRISIIYESINQSVGGYFKGQFKVAFWVFLLLAIGFLILRIEYAIVIAVVVAIIDILPVFASGIVLVPWALVKLFNGDYFNFFGIMIIQILCYLLRQFIQPKILGDTIGVAPIPTLFILYLGFRLGGILGMIVALPIAVILINLYKAGVFETTKQSISVIVGGINRFRRLPTADELKDGEQKG